jgi:Gp5-like OB domain-containing protein
MRIGKRSLRKRVVVLLGGVVVLAVAGTAYATIPDSSGVYTACRLDVTGAIRLIDPSGPATSRLSHCTSIETQITWNQQGQKGDTGAPGVNGVSPTVAQLSPGDSHCPAGGAAITDAAGTTAYVCSGQNGKDGQPFAGTFTSPSGQFSLSVTDAGVEISGPDATVSLPSSGGVTVTSNGSVLVKGDRVETVANNETITVHGDRTETVDNNESITVGGGRTEKVGSNETITVGGSRTEKVGSDENITVQGGRTETVGGTLGLRASGALNLDGSVVAVNGATACKPAARVDDLIDPMAGVILTGSPTVCIG